MTFHENILCIFLFDRWVPSEAKKDGADEDIAKYDGKVAYFILAFARGSLFVLQFVRLCH